MTLFFPVARTGFFFIYTMVCGRMISCASSVLKTQPPRVTIIFCSCTVVPVRSRIFWFSGSVNEKYFSSSTARSSAVLIPFGATGWRYSLFGIGTFTATNCAKVRAFGGALGGGKEAGSPPIPGLGVYDLKTVFGGAGGRRFVMPI